MPSTIPPGTRLGPYEIQSLLGAGGMGEVYRARDSRLQRDVAVKVLPRPLATDQDRLRRFDREARAAGQLNHPNIMAVHDIGSTDANSNGLPYIVCELLEGVTLRTKLATGPIPPRKAIQYATQVARGLAAAHAKGIAHRDLKPENLMILPGDHVKILLGAILYEMLTGRRAFDGPSPADRMTAILTKEPAPLSTEIEDAAPGIGAIIAHTLEKSPADRFDSAADLAFALSLTIARPARRAETAPAAETAGQAPARVDTLPRDLPNRRVTLSEGAVHGARFTPDGKAVCYGGAWEGRPVEIFWTYPGNPESRALGGTRTDLLSIAQSGEMAISVRRVSRGGFFFMGMLARMPIGGGAPREILDGVGEADFHPDGRRLAITREEGGMARIEFPAGTVVYQTAGWVSSIRFSRDGSRIAFLDHTARGSDSGCPAVVDLNGNMKRLSRGTRFSRSRTSE